MHFVNIKNMTFENYLSKSLSNYMIQMSFWKEFRRKQYSFLLKEIVRYSNCHVNSCLLLKRRTFNGLFFIRTIHILVKFYAAPVVFIILKKFTYLTFEVEFYSLLYMESWPFYSPEPRGGYLRVSRTMLPTDT